jgi:hypothetical protein
VLSILGFGDGICNWIDKFFSNRDAAVLMKGNFTDRINLGQGVPQGDIVSPYIFVIAVEILLIKINYSKNLKGITFAKREDRSEAFADDISIFLERKEEYLRNAMKYLNAFSEISGLKCNISKTKVIPIGDFDLKNRLCPDIQLE